MSIRTIKNFHSEEELVSSFLNFLERTNHGRFKFVAEHEAGFGRPDLLLYSYPKKASPDIEALASINPRLAPLLSLMASRSVVSLSDLATISGTSLNSARRIAQELTDIGHLTKNKAPKRELQIRPIAAPPFSQVVAIEAKLRDWRRALVQAYRYLQFSNESWVVLDHRQISSALKMSELFRSSGIGLASFSTEGNLYVHVSAVNRPYDGSALAWRTQAILARHFLRINI